jgi:shikimate kinase
MTEFTYNNNWHSVIKTSSFTTLYQDNDVSRWKNQVQKNSENDVSATRIRIEEIMKLRNQLYKRLRKTKNNQVKYYDEKHTSQFFNVENKILLNFKNIHIFKSLKKLNHKYYESFEIEEFMKK